MPEKGQTPPTARPHPPSLAAASSSSASSQAVGASFFQDRLRLRVSGALPAANARYMANSPSCGVAALHVLTAQPLARLTRRLETPMAHPVLVFACQDSTVRCWPGGSGSFSQNTEKVSLFSIVDPLESRRHPHIGGFAVGSAVVCGRPAGPNAARSVAACMTLLGCRQCSAMQCQGAWPAVASWDDARTFASRLQHHQVTFLARSSAV